ncbi:MAG TPA: MFS transporter [Syntrophobacter fumaroxidans]|nr:MFS transporter [Syntrophobacter fumaroxidans]
MNPDDPSLKSTVAYVRLLFLCCIVCFFCYVGAYMRVPVVPLFALSLGADAFEVGLINSSFLFMAALLSLPLGILSDRLGRKSLILGGILLTSLSSLLLCLCRTPMQMVLVYLLFGVGLAAFAPTLMSYVADFAPATHLGRSYGYYTMALYGGMSLGPALGGALAEVTGYPAVFAISGGFGFLMFCLVLVLLPRTPRTSAHSSRKLDSMAVARTFLTNRPLLGCWMGTLGGCFGLGMFVTFVPLHATEQGISVASIGLIFASQSFFNAFARIPFGHFTDRVKDRGAVVVFGLLGFSIAVSGIAFSTGIFHFIGFSIALGITMSLTFTALGALISEVVPQDSRGLAMGGYSTCIYLGMMLSAVSMGALARDLGFKSAFLVTAGVIALTGVVFRAFVTRIPPSPSAGNLL